MISTTLKRFPSCVVQSRRLQFSSSASARDPCIIFGPRTMERSTAEDRVWNWPLTDWPIPELRFMVECLESKMMDCIEWFRKNFQDGNIFAASWSSTGWKLGRIGISSSAKSVTKVINRTLKNSYKWFPSVSKRYASTTSIVSKSLKRCSDI